MGSNPNNNPENFKPAAPDQVTLTDQASHHLLESVRHEQVSQRDVQGHLQPGDPTTRSALMATDQFEKDLNTVMAKLPGAQVDSEGRVIGFDKNAKWSDEQISAVQKLTTELDKRTQSLESYTGSLNGYINNVNSMDQYLHNNFNIKS